MKIIAGIAPIVGKRAVDFVLPIQVVRRYEFSFHNTDWRDSFGEETVPLVSNE